MKKILFGFALLAACAVHADSYLYWMVGDTGTWALGTSYNGARILAVNQSDGWSSEVLTLADEYNQVIPGKISVTATEIGGVNDFYAQIPTAYAGNTYSFFVELLNDGKAVAHTSTGLDWANAIDYLNKGVMSPAEGAWKASGFVAGAIPEPTSGLLMLLGVAGLALRRRRA